MAYLFISERKRTSLQLQGTMNVKKQTVLISYNRLWSLSLLGKPVLCRICKAWKNQKNVNNKYYISFTIYLLKISSEHFLLFILYILLLDTVFHVGHSSAASFTIYNYETFINVGSENFDFIIFPSLEACYDHIYYHYVVTYHIKIFRT